MDFALSEEQQMMQDGLARLLQKSCPFERRAAIMQSSKGWSKEVWRQYAEMGLLALPFDESLGGLGGSPVETMIVMEQIGRSLALEPYFATVILAGGVLRRAASAQQNERVTSKVIDGQWTLALAHDEAQAQGDYARVDTRATRDGMEWIIDGEKSFALNGDSADAIIVSARVDGQPNDQHGLGLFLVTPNDLGVHVRKYSLHDGRRAASVSLSGVRVEATNVIGAPGDAFALLEAVRQDALAGICAEAVGAMSVLHEMTVDYLKHRRQFGVAIGSFQALQHRAADMYIALEQARSMAMYATMMISDADDASRARAVAAAKVQIGRSGRFIGEQAIQLFGGIGVAMEFKAGHCFKKLTVLDRLMGDADQHLEMLTFGQSLFDAD
ncbi:MAG: pimeloyl-CoA dehydrogenase small subunit [Hyphomicrobiales bacterium]|nr:pimeloyl-CoA dehydrogenase small subunit [Hyphomicrobiales bacterium]